MKNPTAIVSLIHLHSDMGQVLDEYFAMKQELEELREYKRKYDELLNSSLGHSQHMAMQMVKLCMVAGDALQSEQAREMFGGK